MSEVVTTGEVVKTKTGKAVKTNLKLIRDRIMWMLAVMFIVLNLALFFVSRKFAIIPLIMFPMMFLSTFKWSRGSCGWSCSRAAFLEKVWTHVSLKRPVPAFMKSIWFNVLVFVVLMSRVIYVGFTQGLLAAMFLFCVVPTIIALIVGLYSPKAWCAFCPSGSIFKVVDKVRSVFRIRKKGDCTQCGVCDNACPMSIPISKIPSYSFIDSSSCVQCGSCVTACPKDSLEFKTRTYSEKHATDIAGWLN